MIDLGKYAGEVLLSYGVSLALLVGIVWLSLIQSRRMKARMEEVEGRNGKG